MIKGTTPTFRLKLIGGEGVDLTRAKNVYASFSNSKALITKTGDDIVVRKREVYVHFTQQETLNFASNLVEVQLNWTYENGKRASTRIASVYLGKNLIMEVLE